MGAVLVYNSQFQISIERGRRYWFPHRFIFERNGEGIFDASQIQRLVVISGAGQRNAFRTTVAS
ncbi:hypothetical protein MEA186_07809 [Mesorhizobium amorphae CCNWGS0123]|uniref:Uncharacterized protein n=1 Tax=Mesorhizobium amorphae CCNWGS0123 TaxID=1082933 RepID=G6Y6J7_9HYPH|nr:hypothetical protein A6B35_08450 [Mesorhizobium amorphae CCNWGS0123]EHH12687.1 hypothetical protein MEA186_07809 [Mesorhizobium amorphae CCNWGS0123]